MSNSDNFLAKRKRLGDKRNSVLANTTALPSKNVMDPRLAASRRFTRPPELIESMRRLDSTVDPVARKEITDWIQKVYEAYGSSDVVGMFGHCYLGDGHIDHAFSFTGEIIQHFYPTDDVPSIYRAARPLALTDQYAFIEIYSDGTIVPVRPDGTAAV
ncbi:MAG: hypothetical protein KF742_02495 [Cryobacterium sp.]|nr:hypothetical protein [Cryobacterium sp.]